MSAGQALNVPEEMRSEDVLRAAYDVAARYGIQALTVHAVARRAGVAVSLVHGCALQAVIEPETFDVEQHFAASADLLRDHSWSPVARGHG